MTVQLTPIDEGKHENDFLLYFLGILLVLVPLYCAYFLFHPFEPIKYGLVVMGTVGLLGYLGMKDSIQYGSAFWGFLAYILVGALSITQATFLPLSLERLLWLICGLVFYLGFLNSKHQSLLASILVIVAAMESIVLLLQFTDLGFNIVQGLSGKMRMYGTLGNPNYVAGFLMMALPFAVEKFMERFQWRWGVAGGIILIGALLTFSRGAWLCGILAFAMGGIVFWRQQNHQKRPKGRLKAAIVFGGVLVGVILLLMFTPVFSYWQAYMQNLYSVHGRLLIYRVAWEMITSYPWMGIGLEQFGLMTIAYQQQLFTTQDLQVLARLAADVNFAHNDYLQAWAETGFLGVFALIYMLFSPIIRAIKAKKFSFPHISLFFVSLYALIDFPMQTPANFFIICLILAFSETRMALWKLRRSRSALLIFTAILAIWGGNWTLRELAGEWFSRQAEIASDSQQAIAGYQQATRWNPSDTEKYYYLAKALFEAGRYPEAEVAIEQALTGYRRSYVYHLQGQILMAQKKWQAARSVYHLLTDAFPALSTGWIQLEHIQKKMIK